MEWEEMILGFMNCKVLWGLHDAEIKILSVLEYFDIALNSKILNCD